MSPSSPSPRVPSRSCTNIAADHPGPRLSSLQLFPNFRTLTPPILDPSQAQAKHLSDLTSPETPGQNPTPHGLFSMGFGLQVLDPDSPLRIHLGATKTGETAEEQTRVTNTG